MLRSSTIGVLKRFKTERISLSLSYLEQVLLVDRAVLNIGMTQVDSLVWQIIVIRNAVSSSENGVVVQYAASTIGWRLSIATIHLDKARHEGPRVGGRVDAVDDARFEAILLAHGR